MQAATAVQNSGRRTPGVMTNRYVPFQMILTIPGTRTFAVVVIWYS